MPVRFQTCDFERQSVCLRSEVSHAECVASEAEEASGCLVSSTALWRRHGTVPSRDSAHRHKNE